MPAALLITSRSASSKTMSSGEILGDGFAGRGRRDVEVDRLTRGDRRVRARRRFAREGDVAVLDQPLKLRSRLLWHASAAST